LEAATAGGEAGRRVDHRLVAFHHPEARHEADDRHVVRQPERGPDAVIGRRPRAGPELVHVHAPRHRHHAALHPEASGHELAADGLGHGDDLVGGVAVEPAIERVRPHRLDDVPRADEGPTQVGHAIRERGQPVLLAPVDVENLGLGQPRDELPQVAHVGHRADAARQGQGLDAVHAASRAADDAPRCAACRRA
jgi:hypothetical protein